MANPYKAVIFDVCDPCVAFFCVPTFYQIGGVVLRSPFIGIAAYERAHGLPPNYLNCLM